MIKDKYKNTALKAAQQLYSTKNITVKKGKIPSWIIKRMERKTKMKFKYRPRFYVLDKKTDRQSIPIPKRLLNRYTRSLINFDTDRNGMLFKGATIIMPKPIYNNELLRESYLVHELAEILVTQDMMNNLRDDKYPHFMAVQAENKYYKTKHTTKQTQDKIATKLLKNKESWK